MKGSQAESGKIEGFQTNGGDWKWRYQTRQTLLLCVSCILLSATRLPQVSADLSNETAVLLGIKEAWGNPSALATWSREFNTCSQWVYVTCNAENTTITGLMFNGTGNNIQSPLPASIGALVNLQSFYADSWGLTGQIPSTIGLLSNLTFLILSRNGLSGPIPVEIGNLTELSYLNLQNNNFTGPLQDSLAKLRSLTYLSISNNKNSGPLPSWIGSFPVLQYLYLENNDFTGTIPPALGNLTRLKQLIMTTAWNIQSVAGPLPAELGKLTSLTRLILDQNVFQSEIPESYGNLTALESLVLASCYLSGTIPSSFGNLSNLYEIDLSSNSITGSIPVGLGNLHALGDLRLYTNQLTQTIPTQFSQLSNLFYLDLHENHLGGPIPGQLSQLTNLTYLDLSSNSLTGEIPPQLATLPQITDLFFQDNCLSGPVPAYNRNQIAAANFGQSGNSNCFNASQVCKCGGAPAPQQPVLPVAGGDSSLSKTAEHVYIALGVVLGSLLALSGLLFLCFMRHKHQPKGVNPSSNYKGPVREYTLPQVREATSDFTTKVGEGAYATVYKAEFGDGTVAAVKRFNKRRAVESFEKEVELLSNLNHRFLVNLVGYCEDCDAGEFLLLYEFMDRGNLNENLHGNDDHSTIPLTWDERVRVLISVGHGIDYLHYGTDPPMIHRDIKSANILLSSSGSTLIAKLADFGLGRQTVVDADVMTATFGNEPPKAFATRVAGTPGYFDPEYISTSILSAKTDVYSYGVVLLELITGRKPLLEERLTLSNWAKPYLVNEDIWTILDPKLQKGTFHEEQLRAVAELALWCTESDSRNRPTIREVLAVLTDLFSVETGMVDSSLRTSSGGQFSQSESPAYSHRVIEIENSMNYTQSEILPRD